MAARAAIDAQAMPLLGSGDGDPLLRTNAAITAALAGRAEAVPVLVVAIAQSPLPALKITAVLALGAIPAPESVAALAPLTRSGDPGVRNAACVSLGPLREQHIDGAEQAAATCGSATPTPVRQESP
jgi:HEAT repeat protein